MADDKFHFRVNLQELLDAQAFLVKALGDKKVKPILQMVRMEVRSDKLVLRAFNNYLQIETVIPIVNEGPQVQFCVPTFVFTVLTQYKNKKGTITITQLESGKGTLLSKFVVSQELRSNEFSFVPTDKYPEKIAIPSYSLINMSALLEAVNLVKVGAADVSKKAALRCFHFDKDGRVMAGDGIQFAKYEGLKISSISETVLIRVKLVLENIKFLEDIAGAEDCEIGFSEDWVGFRSILRSREIIIQKYTGDPMDYLRVYDLVAKSEPACSVTLNLTELRNVLNLAVLYEGEALTAAYPSYTTINVGKEKVTFSIQIEDLSSNEEIIDSKKFEGEEFSIKIMASKLREIIVELKGDLVTLRIYSKQDPFQVLAEDYPQFDYLQAP